MTDFSRKYKRKTLGSDPESLLVMLEDNNPNGGLTFGELFVFSSLTKTVFLTFNNSSINGQETLGTE